MTWEIRVGDCRETMAGMADNSVDSVVCDPPYELSDGSEASAARVAFKMMLPQNTKFQSKLTGQNELSFLINEVLGLCHGRIVPAKSSAMPVGAVALNDHISGGNKDVEHVSECPIDISDSNGSFDVESQVAEYLGCFSLKSTNPAAFFDALHRSGAGFISGGIGIGFGIDPSCLPSLICSSDSIVLTDDNIRLLNNPDALNIGAFGTAKANSVARLSPKRGASADEFSTISALTLLTLVEVGGAQIVRTDSTTSGLPAELEARRISVVDHTTGRALAFDFVIHPVDIAKTGFMGKEWDGSKIAYDVEVWKQAFRVLKPGGHLLAFSGSRTYHRMACAIEDAGFEIRDQIMWLYSQGFPKSHNVAVAIDKQNGVAPRSKAFNMKGRGARAEELDENGRDFLPPYEAATPEAKQWQGYGTALKPAHEPVCVARKPLDGTVANNILKHGVGGLNIDGCRVGTDGGTTSEGEPNYLNEVYGNGMGGLKALSPEGLGRWPANVIIDGSDEVVAGFPETHARGNIGPSIGGGGMYGHGATTNDFGAGDSGSAARFFYAAKASVLDRNEGLDDFTDKASASAEFRPNHAEKAAMGEDGNPYGRWQPRKNIHPTVKPTDLMRYLCRLVTPPGGLILDPFAGSGSTGKGAVVEGFNFIGCELSEEYAEIARARIAYAERFKNSPELLGKTASKPKKYDFNLFE